MAVTCPICGQTSAGRDVCDYCRSPLPGQGGIVPASALPPPAAPPDPEIPLLVLPVVRRRDPEPRDERPPVRKLPPPPESRGPWLWLGLLGGAFALVAVIITVVVVVALGVRGDKAAPTSKDTRQSDAVSEAERALRVKIRSATVSDDTIKEMLTMLEPKVDKTLIDLGCGDGRLAVRAADQSGAFVVAWDTDPTLVKLANRLAEDHQLRHLVEVKLADDVLAVDLSRADYIVMTRPERFGAPDEVAKRFRKQLRELKPGVRVLTTQRLAPNFRAAKVVPFPPADDPERKWTLYLYVTPLE